MPQIILKPAVYLTRLLNLVYYHLGPAKPWAGELARYFKTTPDKVVAVYLKKRPQTAKLWGEKKRTSEKLIHSFYQETDYFVYRQAYFHRHKIYLDVALAMLLKGKSGSFCEYGAGIGPATAWLVKLFPRWRYRLADLDCPAFKFSKWRFKNNSKVKFRTVGPGHLPLKEKFDIITIKQVLAHVPNPLAVIKHLADHLESGGLIFLDYINHPGEENLSASSLQRGQVLKYLETHLEPVFTINPKSPKEGYGLYRQL